MIKLKTKKVYRAQCIPFGLYIRDLKGVCAQISTSVRAKVIPFFSTLAYQGPCSVLALGGLAASLTGRCAGRMVWECAGIRWMAHMEGKRIKMG